LSYLVLARKWRPQRFEDVIGQEHVVRTLKNSIDSERLAHAYLFTGVRGVGKTSVARILAKALNCEKGPTAVPCNECSHCREITAGNAVDVLEIDGASNTGVDDVRELRENVRYLPQSSRYKVYIIDEVHMLSVAAFNALLKTLEEPPAHVVFIFATTEAHKIPTTILSRCQRFDFRRIARAEIIKGLEDVCRREEYAIDSSDLALIAREAEGSMRDALSLLDQVVSFAGGEVPRGEVARALGIVDRTWISRIIASVMDGDAGAALDIVGRAFDRGYNMRELLRELVAYVRNMAVAAEVGDARDLIDLPDEEIDTIKSQAESASPEKIQSVFEILSRAGESMARVQDARIVLEMALIRATQVEPALPVDEAIRKLREIESRLGPGSSPGPGPAGSSGKGSESEAPGLFDAPSDPAPPGGKNAGGLSWSGMLEAARGKGSPLLEHLLETAGFEGFEDGVLTLSMSADSVEYSQLNDKKKDIEEMASRLCGGKVRVEIVAEKNSGAPRPPRETDRERKIREEAREHPLVKAAQEILQATIRDIKPRKGASRENAG